MNKSRAAAKTAKAQEAMADRIAVIEKNLGIIERKLDELMALLAPADSSGTSKKK